MDHRTIKVLARGDFATSGSPSFACEESVDCHREFLFFFVYRDKSSVAEGLADRGDAF
jgi:hypothetical protein